MSVCSADYRYGVVPRNYNTVLNNCNYQSDIRPMMVGPGVPPTIVDPGTRRRLFAGFRPLSGLGLGRMRSAQNRSISLPESKSSSHNQSTFLVVSSSCVLLFIYIYVSKYPFCWTLSSSWSYVLSSWLVALVSVAVVAVVMVGIRWRELYIDSGRDRETVVFLVSSCFRCKCSGIVHKYYIPRMFNPFAQNLKHHVSVSIDPLILQFCLLLSGLGHNSL